MKIKEIKREEYTELSFFDKWGYYIFFIVFVTAFLTLFLLMIHSSKEFIQESTYEACLYSAAKGVYDSETNKALCSNEDCKAFFQNRIDYSFEVLKNCEKLKKLN